MEIVQDKWKEILQRVRDEHELSEISFTTWIEPLTIHSVEDNLITILVPSEKMGLDYVSKKYTLPIKVAIAEITGVNYEIRFILPEEVKQEKAPAPVQKNLYVPNLNPKYTFDTFVVGSNNKFAHAASLAVAESPGEIYNPLFLYGGVGLGKTHLMHSIAHFILQKNPSSRILYVTSEEFTNEVIEAIRNSNNTAMTKFREKYRNIDVLLIDDVQFIIGKESTQEEFFHTFNNLYESHRQIVLTSDRPPNEMLRLEDRLKTRFEWGLIADIQPPDYETRMAIIKEKALSYGMDIPDDVCSYIAENITTNIRQIEGTVKKILAYKELSNMVMDVPHVSRAIKDMYKGKAETLPTPSLIIGEVCRFYSIEEETLRGTLKNKSTAEARQVAMYLIRKMTNLSLPDIGREFGRDHSTVIHALNKVEKLLQDSTSGIQDNIRDITANVNSKL